MSSIVSQPPNQHEPNATQASKPEERSMSLAEVIKSSSHTLWNFNHTRAALAVELVLLVTAVTIAWSFWHVWCPGDVETCLGNTNLAPAHYLLLSLIRPFVLTPHVFGTYIAAQSFSSFDAIALSVIASALSASTVYGLAYLVGKHLVVPWMTHNLPSTLRFIRTQDYKLVFAMRLIPIFPFDIVSAFAGFFTLSYRRFIVYTMLGILPECIFLVLMSSPRISIWGWTVNAAGVFATLVLVPLLIFDWHSRRRGRSLINTLMAAYNEIMAEARLNNQIIKRNKIDPSKTPVLLIYGFFSSRRSLSLVERQLVAAGFEVLSFNLGGMFGTFFTQGVAEAAAFIDYKLKRQFARHGFEKVHIVAHSKGTLVAYWWLLKLGGSKYCDKLIAMASPCSGSYYVYLALITPLGFFWRDMWQMRPGSSFLKELANSEIPPTLKVWSLYSDNDRLAKGAAGLYRPKKGAEQITVVGMHQCDHFDFILKRGPIKEVINILKEAQSQDGEQVSASDEEGTSLSSILGEDDQVDAPLDRTKNAS